MSQNYTPEFKKKIVRLHEEEGRTCKSQKTGMPVKLPLTDFASTDMIGEFDGQI